MSMELAAVNCHSYRRIEPAKTSTFKQTLLHSFVCELSVPWITSKVHCTLGID